MTVIEPSLVLSLCADSLATLGALGGGLAPASTSSPAASQAAQSVALCASLALRQVLTYAAAVESSTFGAAQVKDSTPDLINDDVPFNPGYLDKKPTARSSLEDSTIVSNIDGETIRVLSSDGLRIVDDYLTPERYASRRAAIATSPSLRIAVQRAEISLQLHEGYDWPSTRSHILNEIKAVRRRLHKIRQVMAEGQTPDETAEEIAAPLFASVCLPMPPDVGTGSTMDADTILNTLSENLPLDEDVMDLEQGDADSGEWDCVTAGPSTSSNVSRLVAPSSASRRPSARQQLMRRSAHAISFDLKDLDFSLDQYPTGSTLNSLINVRAESFEILDNIKTSTWHKFLTELRVVDGGVVRPTGAPMLRARLAFSPSTGNASGATEEASLKVKISPLRLHIDQDALDFLKAFFSFAPPDAQRTDAAPDDAFIRASSDDCQV